jgi:hypothetical protein
MNVSGGKMRETHCNWFGCLKWKPDYITHYTW